MTLSPYRKMRIAAFWVAVTVAYVFAVMPGEDAPSLHVGGDKTDHMAAFFTLAVLARLAYPAAARTATVLGLAAFGAWIEISQGMSFIGRDADIWDWVADMVALLVGLALVWPAERRFPKLFAL
jgi:VanZ family protein